MLSLKAAHEPGLTLSSAGHTLVLTGGADGVVSLFTKKALLSSGGSTDSIWARRCHDGAVTAVWLSEGHALGFSCGRDGKVILHEHLAPKPASTRAASDEEAAPGGGMETASNESSELEPTSRVICRVTGECRCLWFDSPRHRLFIGGDSLRCLLMDQKPFQITTIPLVVPHPIVAVSCNESGDLLAMASAVSDGSEAQGGGGAVGVVSVHPKYLLQRQLEQQQQQQQQSLAIESQSSQLAGLSEGSAVLAGEKDAFLVSNPHFIPMHRAVRFRLPSAISRSAIKDELTSLKMYWASLPSKNHSQKKNANGENEESQMLETESQTETAPHTLSTETSLLHAPQLLLVPGKSNVQVYRFQPCTVAPYVAHRMDLVGSIHGASNLEEALSVPFYYFSVAAYRLSARRFMCVMCTPGGVSAVKLDTSKLSTVVTSSQSYANLSEMVESSGAADGGASKIITVSSVDVCPQTGDVVIGLSDGKVSFLKHFAPREGKVAASPSSGQRKTAENGTLREAKNNNNNDNDNEEIHDANQRPLVSKAARPHQAELFDDEDDASALLGSHKHHEHSILKQHKVSKRQVSDFSEDSSFINDESEESENESDGASSTTSSSGSSSSSADEDFSEVVHDLKRANGFASELPPRSHRPSRWRRRDTREAMSEATRELRAHPTATSRFLDDEADEVSSEEVRNELREAEEELGYGDVADDDDGVRDGYEDEEEEDRGLGDEEEEEGGYRSEENGLLGDVANGGKIGAGGFTMRPYSFQVGATPFSMEKTTAEQTALSEEEEVDGTRQNLASGVLEEASAGSCYLAYNGVGYIHQISQSTVIHFHNVAIPAIRLREAGEVRMGTLSPVGAGFVIASLDEEEEEDVTASHERQKNNRFFIYYRSFAAMGAQSEWRLRLPQDENVLAMAAGMQYLAVATTKYLRIYSISGLEIAVLSKFSFIVTLLGMGSQRLYETVLSSAGSQSMDPLVVVYMDPSGEHRFEILDITTRSSVSPPQSLALTPAHDKGPLHQLQWIGWSDDGPLHTVDTAGVVRMFTKSWGGSWIPVYEPALEEKPPQTLVGGSKSSFRYRQHALSLQRPRTYLWIWGVSDRQLFAYRCSEKILYPLAVAGGLPVEHVPLVLPLTKHPLADRQSAAWESLLRQQIRTDELKQRSEFYTAGLAKRDAVHDATLIDLFNAALKDQQTTRAVDIAQRLELRDNVETCAKLANKAGYAQLVQRLLKILEERMKKKLKRKCNLPLEGTAVSEKEKDRLLRRLLLKEKKDQEGSRGATIMPNNQISETSKSHEPMVIASSNGNTSVPPLSPTPDAGSLPADSHNSPKVSPSSSNSRSPEKSDPERNMIQRETNLGTHSRIPGSELTLPVGAALKEIDTPPLSAASKHITFSTDDVTRTIHQAPSSPAPSPTVERPHTLSPSMTVTPPQPCTSAGPSSDTSIVSHNSGSATAAAAKKRRTLLAAASLGTTHSATTGVNRPAALAASSKTVLDIKMVSTNNYQRPPPSSLTVALSPPHATPYSREGISNNSYKPVNKPQNPFLKNAVTMSRPKESTLSPESTSPPHSFSQKRTMMRVPGSLNDENSTVTAEANIGQFAPTTVVHTMDNIVPSARSPPSAAKQCTQQVFSSGTVEADTPSQPKGNYLNAPISHPNIVCVKGSSESESISHFETVSCFDNKSVRASSVNGGGAVDPFIARSESSCVEEEVEGQPAVALKQLKQLEDEGTLCTESYLPIIGDEKEGSVHSTTLFGVKDLNANAVGLKCAVGGGSLAEVLRKRYREEDDEEVDAVPLSIPRIDRTV